jgi:23S rRNA (adenine2030-N6)-methyltransferase
VNYQHAFHAGNFADVHKHVVLLAILDYLKTKSSPFFVLDTHAGRGSYDLSSEAARRGGEWQQGIGKVMSRSYDLAEINHYVDAVKQYQSKSAEIQRYPGSPLLIAHSLRNQDRGHCFELNPIEAEALTMTLPGNARIAVSASDGYAALKSQLPPKENRGLVLIDPPYEVADEYTKLFDALLLAHKRWRNGIYCVWYPIKAGSTSQRFLQRMQQSGIKKILTLELNIRPPDSPLGLNGSGLMIINPPYRLDERMRVVLPFLHTALSEGGGVRVEWLVGE